MRVGVGYDIHRLVEGRRLVLGGVEIPFAKGLAGHSDGDAVLHAVIDAVLGAAALPDIGELFPDDDENFAGIDSAILVAQALSAVKEKGYRVGNVDVNVIAERPKLKPYKEAMAARVAELLEVAIDCVSMKAKTREGLGPVGENLAIEVHCVALLEEVDATP